MANILQILGAAGKGIEGYGIDRENRVKSALASRKLAGDEERDRLLNALTRAQTTKLGQPEPLPESTYAQSEFLVDDATEPTKGFASNRGGYFGADMKPITGKVRPYEAPKAAPRDPVADHAANRKTDVDNPLPVQSVPRPPNEAQTRAQLVYPRAATAAQQLEEFYTKGAPLKSAAGKIPIVGNYVLSEDEQRMNQAAETVASAILRLESGAAITKDEVTSYAKQFLAVPGDSPEVREQKRATLKQQIEAIRALAERGSLVASAPSTGPNASVGAPAPAAKPDLARRVQQLRASGKSREESMRILQSEGYDLSGRP